MKLAIQLILWIVIGFLAYLLFMSVYEPVQFEDVKKQRYQKVINKMKKIRDAQLAYKKVTGVYAPSFDNLTRFIDTASFTLTQRRDTTYLDKEYQKNYGVDKYIDDVVIDTLGSRPVKDSLYGNSSAYRTFRYVPTTENEEFEIAADSIYRANRHLPVFEVKVHKKVLLKDQPEDIVRRELQKKSVDDVNGEYIRVGSMKEVNTNGNWPKFYGKEE